METVDLVLAAAPLFQGVDPDALRTALTGSHELMLSGGKTLLDPAESNNEIFVILDGEMLVCLEPDPTNPIVRLGTGECVGELSIIDARPPSAYVITAGPCRVLAIPQAVLWNLLASQQPTAFNLLRILTRRIRENNAVILSTLEVRREQSRKVETDEVTGLRTRAWADDVFPRQIDLCERIGQRVSFLILDIDYFAKLNDLYGTEAGDQALRHAGRVVGRSLRLNDLCARFGGDEIAVLMPATEAVHARLTAERLRGAVAAMPMRLALGLDVSLTISGGLAEWHPGQTFADLADAAIEALCRAKAAGRNQIVAVKNGSGRH